VRSGIITGGFTGAACRVESFNGPAILAAQVIEIRDVVIRLRNPEEACVLLAKGTSPLKAARAAGIVEANQGKTRILLRTRRSLRASFCRA